MSSKVAATKATKQVTKAKQAQKNAKSGKRIKKHRIHTQVRFHRETPLKLARKPKYARSSKQVIHKVKGSDIHSILRHPLITEKDMKKMEDENTMVFIVNSRATKPQIKKAFEKVHGVHVRQVNTLNTFQGKKKAYIRLAADSEALNLANKIGII